MALFGTAGIRGSARERVTPELALAVGHAIGVEAAQSSGSLESSNVADLDCTSGRNGVVLARDGRTTGPALLAALEAGITSVGARVYRAGTLPTPALAYASRGRWGVMVTASHNPPTDNGIKCFADGEEIRREVEERIERRIADGVGPAAWDEWQLGERIEPLTRYREAVVSYACEGGASLSGLTVAVDCANGVSALATPQVLRALGAEVVALHANLDGFFPGRPSKPTSETLADLRAFVAGTPEDKGTTRASGDGRTIDLAIAHDGDGDRVVILDGEGEVIHEDTVLAIVAEHYVRASDVGDPVVITTPNASSRIDERVAAAGGRVERVRLGALHEGIAAARENGGEETSVVFAAEPWKHVHPGFGPWIDGVASAAVIAGLVADSGIETLRAPVTERPYEKTAVNCADSEKGDAMARLETSLPDAFPDAAVAIEHGIRLDLDTDADAAGGGKPGSDLDGWVLVRPSGTEPYLRIYVESESMDAVLERALRAVESAVADASSE